VNAAKRHNNRKKHRSVDKVKREGFSCGFPISESSMTATPITDELIAFLSIL